MSALDALLRPRPRSTPADHRHRSLLLDQDVRVHLLELPRLESVALCSAPAGLAPPAGLSARAWSHALPLPADPRASAWLRVQPGSPWLLIGETWPRAALDACTFGQRLDAHLRHHRHWREQLLALGAEAGER